MQRAPSAMAGTLLERALHKKGSQDGARSRYGTPSDSEGMLESMYLFDFMKFSGCIRSLSLPVLYRYCSLTDFLCKSFGVRRAERSDDGALDFFPVTNSDKTQSGRASLATALQRPHQYRLKLY